MADGRTPSLLNYIDDLTTINAEHVESVTEYLGKSARFTCFNNSSKTEAEKDPVIDDEQEEHDVEKHKSRERHPENWRQNIRKRNKNRGLEYIKANGDVSAKKEMGPACTCQLKCFARIGPAACKRVFNNFWKLGDYSLQNAYLAGCVRIFLPKQYSKSFPPGRRFYSRCFYVNVNGVDTEICKQAFLSLHSISNGRLDRLLKKKQEVGNTGTDARGKHNNKVNKIPIEKIREVRNCIDGLRKKAGFTGKRKSKNVEIFNGPLNIRSMYKIYLEEVVAKGLEPVCEFRFRKIFHNDFHIDFARPTVNPTPPPTPKPVESRAYHLQLEAVTPCPQDQEGSNVKAESTPHLSFNIEDKPVYTTLETKDAASNTQNFPAFNPDFYSSYPLPHHNWFPTQT